MHRSMYVCIVLASSSNGKTVAGGEKEDTYLSEDGLSYFIAEDGDFYFAQE